MCSKRLKEVETGRERRRNAIMAAVKRDLKFNKAFVAPELLQGIAETITPSKYYLIEVIRSANEAVEKLTLKNYETCGDIVDVRVEESGTVVFGDVRFGSEQRFYSHEFNDGEQRTVTCNFNPNKAFAVLVQHYESDFGGGNDSEDYINTIMIYVPKTISYKPKRVALRGIERAELCQLRYNLPKAE